ncbi:hypothetical protein HO665_01820 [Streptococcus suis]|nr:hypothetical protein [Streptococcus suis]NQH96652.1 hypothetical protein [Streptococcus suis]
MNAEFEREYQESLKKKQKATYYLLIAFVLLVLAGLVWTAQQPAKEEVATYSPSSVSTDLQLSSTISQTWTEASDTGVTDFTRGLTATQEEFSFNWTLKDYDSLVTGMKEDATGDSLSDIIEKYGKPSSARFGEYSEENLFLTYAAMEYGINEDQRNLKLVFYKNGSDYYLMNKEVYYLPDDQFPTKEADPNTNLWTKEVFQQVIVGDSNTGQGGMSYEEVIALGGLPYEATLFAYGGGIFEERKELQVFYKNGSGSKQTFVDFRFVRQKDGIYRVYAKNGTFYN